MGKDFLHWLNTQHDTAGGLIVVLFVLGCFMFFMGLVALLGPLLVFISPTAWGVLFVVGGVSALLLVWDRYAKQKNGEE